MNQLSRKQMEELYVSAVKDSFQQWEIESEEIQYKESVRNANRRMMELQLEDMEWKIKSRPRYGRFFLWFLSLQNLIVFSLVCYSVFTGSLNDLQIVLGVLVSATLAETAFTVNIIVKWLFNDINYKLHKDRN